MLRHRLFAALWLLIVAISVYDGWWIVVNREILLKVEQNPLGQWLLALNRGDVRLLLAAKSVGTVLAASLLLLLYWSRPYLGWIACVGAAAFQLWLLWFLHAA
jgi:hypothetical protein